MKFFRLAISLIIILASFYLCQQIISLSVANQLSKKDYAELNHVKYGLFSVDKWKEQISLILSDEISKLELTSDSEQELKKLIEAQLNTLINKINHKIKEGNEGSATGWVKQRFIDIFINVEDIKKGIPEYADAIIKETKKSKNKVHIKTLLNGKLEEYIRQTFDSQDISQLIRILYNLNSNSIEEAKIKLNNEIALKNHLIARNSIVLILLSVILFSLAGFGHKKALSPTQYILLVTSLLILLTVGIATPMIDMEAKISKMSFVLLDHTVQFENQVLYFQTKSILDVSWIMLTNKAIQMKFVGLLAVTFSIFFPLIKIISSLIYYFNFLDKRQNRFIHFFVFKSGKWSMADVLVVAIFMAYIGFNGIITTKLGELSTMGPDLVLLATNGTALQPGFYVFLTYTILALFLSDILSKPT